MIDTCIAKLNEVKLGFANKPKSNPQPGSVANTSTFVPPAAPPLPNFVQPSSKIKVKTIDASVANARSLLKQVPNSTDSKQFDVEVQEKIK